MYWSLVQACDLHGRRDVLVERPGPGLEEGETGCFLKA